MWFSSTRQPQGQVKAFVPRDRELFEVVLSWDCGGEEGDIACSAGGFRRDKWIFPSVVQTAILN